MSGPTQTSRSTPSAGQRYHMLRISLLEYGTEPEQLQESERERVRNAADATWRWQRRVLRAPEAASAWVPGAMADEAFGLIVSRFSDLMEFRAALGRAGLSAEDLRTAIAEELQAEAVVERVASRAAAIAPGEVRAHYQQHPERFRSPEARKARQILITVNPDYPENTPECARQRLQGVLSKLGNSVEGFARQALRHSECPSALDGGQLGWVQPRTLYPELDRTLFQLPPGSVSRILESPLGFHLLRCDAVREARVEEFARVAPRIRSALADSRRRQALRSWASSLPG